MPFLQEDLERIAELYNIIDAIDCSIGEDTDIMDLSSERDKMETIRHKL